MIDVRCVLNDPLISDTFDVTRNVETVGANGRTVMTPQSFPGQRGIVKPEESGSLKRQDDGQYVGNEITIISTFALRDATSGFQPDSVTWDGVDYTVLQALPYRRLAGFTKARCASTSTPDAPQ